MIPFAILLFFLILIGKKRYDVATIIMIATYPTLSLFSIGVYKIVYIVMLLLILIVFVRPDLRTVSISNPFRPVLILLFSSYLLTFLLRGPYKIGQVLSLTQACALPVLTWVFYEPSKNQILFRRIFSCYLIFLSIYGIYEGISFENPIMNWLDAHKLISLNEFNENYVRFGFYRAQSLTEWCSTFGTTCAVGMVYFVNKFMEENNLKKVLNVVLVFSCVSAVFICGTRSVIACACIMLLSIVKYFKNVRWILISLITVLIGVTLFQDYLNEVVDAFVNYEDAGGSSVEMRVYQFAATLSFLQSNPIFGNGLGFVNVAMDLNAALLGAESIIFIVLIDRGIWGIITVYLMWVLSIYKCYKTGYVFLAFLLLGLAFAKTASALTGISETFVLPIIIMLIKDNMYKNSELQ